MTEQLDQKFLAIHDDAQAAARESANDIYSMCGDTGSVGFAWVTVYNVRSNSKLGKALISKGFTKGFGRKSSLMLWNPAQMSVQSMAVLEAGAREYAKQLLKIGIDAHAQSRMD